MKKLDYVLKSFLSAAGVIIYVLAVALLLSNGQNIFGQGKDSLLIPMFMLLLFIVSASITGLLVLGKPIHLYFNNFKKEALVLLFSTLGWLVVFLITVIVILLIK